MPNTPKGLTYPSSSSPVAVPADLQELATDVDGLIVPNTGGTYTGSVSFTQSPSVPTPTSGLHAVNKTYADLINTDVTALETELGTNPSGTFSTVADRLNTQDHPASTTDNTVARYDGTQGKLQTSTVVIDDNGRLTTVTGATGGYGFVGGAVHLTGTGSPESVISAAPGSTYLQTDSVVDVKGWIKWIKATGTGNTGWIAGPEADTGWRSVVGAPTSGNYYALENGWEAWGSSGCLIRRTGNDVYIFGQLTRRGASTADDWVHPLPAGFRCMVRGGGGYTLVCHGSTYGSDITAPSSFVAVYNGYPDTSGQSHGVFIRKLDNTQPPQNFSSTYNGSFLTANAWPTSLPGTAA